MGKISLVSAKYIIHATIEVEGVVDRPDVIGSIFGQTEGLLGSDLELRELQSSGRIGRIEVDTNQKKGKTEGRISIPSSMDKTETALIAAALETIERIGPCNAKVKVEDLEDVRTAKRGQIISRAKSLLSELTHGTLPDSRDIKDEVSSSVKVKDVIAFGKDKLPAGPAVEESEDIILVEGRADVINLLKHDIKNAISMNGTSVPKTIIELSKSKTVTVFVDGDRGGDLIIKELGMVADIDYATKAPDGKEVEEITKKEINQALRNAIPFKNALERFDSGRPSTRGPIRGRDTRGRPSTRGPIRGRDTRGRPSTRGPIRGRDTRGRPSTRGPIRGRDTRGRPSTRGPPRGRSSYRSREERPPRITVAQKGKFKELLDDLVGSKGAYILDSKSNMLGKVPIKELGSTIEDLGRTTHTVIIDGSISEKIFDVAEKGRVKFLIGKKSNVKPSRSTVTIITGSDL